jgi:stage V sporulation protein G
MEITQVRVFPVEEEKLKAFVSVIFDDNGLFISMPSKKRKNGTFRDIAHPLNNETRRRIEEHIIRKYREVVSEEGGSAVAPIRALNPEEESALGITGERADSPGVGGEGEDDDRS